MDSMHKNDWQRAADKLKMEPNERVWTRLEHRLDQDTGKVSISRIRQWMGIAATLLLLIGFALFSMVDIRTPKEIIVIQDLEERTPKVTFAAYQHVSDINRFYESDQWKQIDEGRHKPLILSSNQKSFNTVPSKLAEEDSSLLY